ncbi:hypothetical protein [Bradyrhizobium sp. dw_78]|uniref:hypothetical protein n=1 Tax=Bradyrhizobium sp. dw_78 TaxID=2719793 RepID=UPI001BD33DF3|nr:hypothetical protein [Bradyrhizobium sp. dw_78]
MTDGDQAGAEPERKDDAASPKSEIRETALGALRSISGHLKYAVDTLNWLSPILTAVATGLLVWVAIWQWIEMHSTDGTLRESLRAQIKSSELQLRAYLAMDAKAFELHCESCDPPDAPKIEKKSAFYRGNFIMVFVRNSGQTPAIDSYMHGSWKEMPFGATLPLDFKFPNIENNVLDDKGTVNPGDSIPGAEDLSSETIQMINRARKHQATIFFYGEIVFRDVFKKIRRTPFCRIYDPDIGDETLRFGDCPEHNSPAQDD